MHWMTAACCASNTDLSVPREKHIEWITNLPASLHDEPISKLAIPGSHNSFAYDLTRTAGPDLSVGLRRFLPLIGCFIKRWSVTQKETFIGQLETGIRYFDLRVCRMTDKASNQTSQFNFTHDNNDIFIRENIIERFLLSCE
ncbi:unnamed protein product [Rotaria sordida]|uniref:Uncharacterized protein n=1 Tax=Rotaria sordida TaxID=392033 RepID=A0A814D937_9BILA|nr:unnamed protein product [Rotaria sordida]